MTTRVQNVLYVTSEGAWLSRDHDTVVVSVERQKRAQVPLAHLEGIVIFGGGATSDLLGFAADAGVAVAFFSRNDRFLARVEGMPGGNVLLRRAQFRAADDPTRTLGLARAFVIGKVANTRRFLRRAARDASGEASETIAAAAEQVARVSFSIGHAQTLDELRGFEGAVANVYFGVFRHLLKVDDVEWSFGGRSRRPPKDRINALLSFGYALLLRDCAGALAGVGLDPGVGFLHAERPGRLALALDLMEELRLALVDRLVLAMVNRGQLRPSEIVTDGGGGFRLTDDARKEFVIAYQKAKQSEVRHEFLAQATQYAMVAHWQARILARTLRGDMDAYVPFEMPG